MLLFSVKPFYILRIATYASHTGRVSSIHAGRQGQQAGKMRVESKEYIVKDGDVMHFRFNV